MTRQRLVGLFVLVPAAIIGSTAASCTANGTGTGTFTPAPTTSAPPVGNPGPPTDYPTETTEPTEEPTGTTEPTVPPTTPPVLVPGPGDEDFVELDCADFPLEAEDGSLLDAQDVFNQNRLDIHGLDADGDGTACEDTDPAANATDDAPDSPDESAGDAADVAVAPEGEMAGLTIDVRSY